MPRVLFSGLFGYVAPWPVNPRRGSWLSGLLALLLGAACSQQRGGTTEVAAPLNTGHFEGSVTLAEGPVKSFKLVLELRHPRAGHYEAEVLAPTQPGLSFVADTVDFQAPTLRLTRPGQPSQHLALTREGDFWRGTLTLDSAQVPVLLLRRGSPAPATYRVSRPREPALGSGPLLFAPADETMAGPALALLPAAQHAALAPHWADALARAGIIVLLLPPSADSAAADLPAAQAALRYLRITPGADTARLGVWATAGRAAGLAAGLPSAGPPQPNFLVLQQLANSRALRPALRQLPAVSSVLGLYDEGTPSSRRGSAALRAALGRQGRRVRVVPAQDAGAAVVEWLGPMGE